MTKEQQDLAWACLPRETRDAIKYELRHTIYHHVRDIFFYFFGHHNLISDTEPEGDAFVIPVSQVRETYAYNEHILKLDPTHKGAQMLQSYLLQTFGDKCLPDKEEQNIPKHSNSFQIGKFFLGKNEQPEPKFKKGEIVRVTSYDKFGVVGRIIKVDEEDDGFMYTLEGVVGWRFAEKNLEPYTEEPETKRKETQTLSLSDEELDHIIFELIRIRDNRRENERQLMEAIAKLKKGYATD